MKEYLDKLEEIFTNGTVKTDRTGVGTKSIFGMQMRFDLREEFPVVTTKKIHLKSVIHELLWMISGDRYVTRLREAGVSIWDEWVGEDGDAGRIYGQQWRHWAVPSNVNMSSEFVKRTWRGMEFDQLRSVIDAIKKYPDSRRLLVTAWNPAEIHCVRLPPCHVMFQFYIVNGELSCSVYQRSADFFLGVPFNISSYALLTHMVADVCGLEVGDLIWSGGDCHIYKNHFEQVEEQLSREPMRLPKLVLNHRESIDDFVYEDVQVVDYVSHPAIKAEVAV